ncbi:hypothetical protein CRE_13120 [Caenorhabditis remanei]|uniref:DUF4708 domain-containing protein n=1 Tax=Caenorhabditis remanei TaxID=31234 RepID=E3NIM1_CAERE|nr:hypothetical protein CRE_13120 [Caenorhabditis remanei]
MASTVISVASFDIKTLKTYYLKVDMEFDNRKNAALAILNKLCRDFLKVAEQFGGCLALPRRDFCTILVILSPEFMKNEKIIDFLEKQHLTIKLECECDSSVIEESLPFAVFWFMERVKWFRIGDCFVQDGFLWWKQTNLPRIQIKTHCSETGNIYIKFTAEHIRIHPFEHWILDSDERFSDLTSGPISRQIRPRRVACLPKLGKGQIVKIHRKIPEAPFENYEQMMSYWKKSYGYDLPPAEPEVYYDILFHNGQTMLYPLYCVLTGPPDVLPLRSNSKVTKESLETFLKAFREADIEILGQKFNAGTEQDCQAAKCYMEVMSMRPNSKLPKLEKVHRKNSEEMPQIRKIYPKIPIGVKRSISSSTEPPVKRERRGFSIPVE